MTEDEKRYKIKKIEKYSEELDKKEKECKDKIWSFIVRVCILCLGILNVITWDNTLVKCCWGLTSVFNTAGAVDYLKRLISAINDKTILKAKIEELDEELQVFDSSIKRGR